MKKSYRETIAFLLLLAVVFLIPRSVASRLSLQMGTISLALDELAVVFLLLILSLTKKKTYNGPGKVPDRFYRHYLFLVTLVLFVSLGTELWYGHELILTFASFVTVFMTETLMSMSMKTGLIFWIAFYAISVEKVFSTRDHALTRERSLEES